MLKNFLTKSVSISTVVSSSSSDNDNAEDKREELVTIDNLQQKSIRRSFSFTHPVKVEKFEEIANSSHDTSKNSIDPYSPTNLKKSRSITFSGKHFPIVKRTKSVQFKLANNSTIELSPSNNPINTSPTQGGPHSHLENSNGFTLGAESGKVSPFKEHRTMDNVVQRRLSAAFEDFPLINEESFKESDPSAYDLSSGGVDSPFPLSTNYDTSGDESSQSLSSSIKARHTDDVQEHTFTLLKDLLEIEDKELNLDDTCQKVIQAYNEKLQKGEELMLNIDTLRKEKESIEASLSKEHERVEFLTIELETKSDELEIQCKTLSESYQKQLEELKLDNDSLSNEKIKLRNMIQRYRPQENCIDLAELVEDIFRKEEEFENKAKDSNDVIQRMSLEINQLKFSEHECLSKYNQTKDSLDRSYQENSILWNQLKEIRENFTDLESIINKKDDQIKTLESSLNNRELLLIEMRIQLQDSRTNKSYLEARIEDLLLKIQSLNGLLSEAENNSRIDTSESELLENQTENVRLAHKRELLKSGSKVKEIKNVIYVSKDKPTTSNELVNVLKQEVEHLVSKNIKLQHDHEISEKSLDMTKKILNQIQDTNAKLLHYKSVQKQKYVELHKSNHLAISSIKQLFKGSWESISPLIYEDSQEYFETLYSKFDKKAVLHSDDGFIIDKLTRFYQRVISDLVNEFKVHEKPVYDELDKRERK
ncbi:uncharacterized protein RJT21DRAFT_114719 [Scheffersomyces amazonensis]|uniref:uncharacterized protein n=1 Tax=Scheffersomyces amazonensis TaxID=1078765 RepID=UPI00315CA2ED